MTILNSFLSYNSLVVILGTSMLGCSAGATGTLLLLRKRSLLSDAISHATLPGICLAFIIVNFFAIPQLSFLGMLIGASLSSLAGIGIVLFLHSSSTLKEGVIISIVISTFFGWGIFLLSMIQKLPTGSAAGLNRFLYGKTASMLASDSIFIFFISLVVFTIIIIFFKEINLTLCDSEFARTQGYSPHRIDILLSVLSLLTVIAGLQAVGLILIIAQIIIPAVSALSWTKKIHSLMFLSVIFALISNSVGSMLSTTIPSLPAGAIIVLMSGFIFLLSSTLGSSRGLLHKYILIRREQEKMREHYFLILFIPLLEGFSVHQLKKILSGSSPFSISYKELLERTQWKPRVLNRFLHRRRKNNNFTIENHHLVVSPKGIQSIIERARSHEAFHLVLRKSPEIIHLSPYWWKADYNLNPHMDEQNLHQLRKEHPLLFSVDLDDVLEGGRIS